MSYNLAIDIKVSGDGTKLWIIDETIGYNQGSNIRVEDITAMKVTFLKQHPINLDYSDWVINDDNTDIVCRIDTTGKLTTQNDMVMELVPSDLSTDPNPNSAIWSIATLFAQGIYHIKYEIEVTGNNTPPSNFTNYYYSEVLFWDIERYYQSLLLKLAKEMMLDKIDTNYLTWYTITFGAKFDAFKETINIGNIPVIRKSLTYLNTLMQKYPEYNDSRRYYKMPFRN